VSDPMPLLIAATLDAGNVSGVALRGLGERVLRHMEALLAWLRDPFFKEIVLVKNCSLRINVEPLKEVAEAHGKHFEFVQVQCSIFTEKRGKGFGEGDMIRQAFRESEILGRSDGFCKATGKLYLQDAAMFYSKPGEAVFFKTNAPQCGSLLVWRRLLAGWYRSARFHRLLPWLHLHARVPWSLVAAAPTRWVDTRFYRVTKCLYWEHVAHSYERVDDALGYSLEAAFADDLPELSECIFVKDEPIVFGYSGTRGTAAAEFSEEIRRQAAELTARIL
jgi:hypothetical protein